MGPRISFFKFPNGGKGVHREQKYVDIFKVGRDLNENAQIFHRLNEPLCTKTPKSLSCSFDFFPEKCPNNCL